MGDVRIGYEILFYDGSIEQYVLDVLTGHSGATRRASSTGVRTMAEHAEKVRIDSARTAVADAILELSNCDGAMLCPIHDWLVALREVLIDMAHTDGLEVSDA